MFLQVVSKIQSAPFVVGHQKVGLHSLPTPPKGMQRHGLANILLPKQLPN